MLDHKSHKSSLKKMFKSKMNNKGKANEMNVVNKEKEKPFKTS
jgi:hypothetical protein